MSQGTAQKLASCMVAHPAFEAVSTALILVNAAALGLLTYKQDLIAAGWGSTIATLEHVDLVCLIFFTAEVLLRMSAAGRSYFKEPWNVFDLLTVVISLLAQNPLFSAIRVLRTLRVFRLLARFKTLRLISSVMVGSLSGCFSISVIMALVMFVFAIVGNELYAAASPEQFGNLHRAMHTLFKVSSLYDYDSVVNVLADKHPSIYLYLIPFFLLMSYVFINFFSAIVVYLIYEISFDELKTGRRLGAAEAGTEDESDTVNSAGVAVAPDLTARLDELMREMNALRDELRSSRGA